MNPQRAPAESPPGSPETAPRERPSSGPRLAAAALAAAAAYYFGSRLGLLLTPPGAPLSTLWPPNAILMATLLLSRPGSWWVLLVAVLPAHLAAQIPDGILLDTSLGWYATNSAEALLGAGLLRGRVDLDQFLGSLRQAALFVLAAGIVVPVATSFLDAGVVVATGWAGDFWEVWRMRVPSNALSNLTVVPVVVALVRGAPRWLRRVDVAQLVEAGALLVASVLVGVYALGGAAGLEQATPALLYAPLPLFLWAAVRFGPSGLSLSVLLFAVLSIRNVIEGRGVFSSGSLRADVLGLQAFFVLSFVPMMVLAALIRERRLTEVALRESEERLALAADAARLGFWSWTPSTGKVWTTEEARKAYGLAPDALPDWRDLERAVPSAQRLTALRALGEALPGQGPHVGVFRRPDAGGPERWVEERAQIVPASGGTPVRVTGAVLDVTERQRAELEAEQQRLEIAHLARVATLGELSGALAHELNQPLAAILLNAQTAQRLLDSGAVDVEVLREILGEIAREDVRAATVIQHLRSLLRKGEAELQRIDLNDVARDTLDLVRGDLVGRDVTVTTRLADDRLEVDADPVQLQQLLINLLVNACDAVRGKDAAGRQLELESTREPDGALRLSVSDRGEGLPIERPERIFEPFYTTKPTGLGFGLTICRTIARAHGGSLSALNREGGGATFRLRLPPPAPRQ